LKSEFTIPNLKFLNELKEILFGFWLQPYFGLVLERLSDICRVDYRPGKWSRSWVSFGRLRPVHHQYCILGLGFFAMVGLGLMW